MDLISVKDDMPKEEDSVFARCYGTTRWTNGMFRKVSKKVLVTFEKGNGQRETITGRTEDGQMECFGKCQKKSWLHLRRETGKEKQ